MRLTLDQQISFLEARSAKLQETAISHKERTKDAMGCSALDKQLAEYYDNMKNIYDEILVSLKELQQIKNNDYEVSR